MPTIDPRVDAYIANSAEFARPILVKLRALVHRGCPAVVETIKWGMPHFEHHGILCGMAAFKAHCAFGFWKGKLLAPTGKEGEAMGEFGCIRSLADLPTDRLLLGYIQKAAEFNESGVTRSRPPRTPKAVLATPPELVAAFAQRKHARAKATFEKFSPSHRREYVEWIDEAKRPETRAKRLATTLEWLADGKPRNWKYMK